MTISKHRLYIFFFLKSEILKAFTIYTVLIIYYMVDTYRGLCLWCTSLRQETSSNRLFISVQCVYLYHYSTEQFLDIWFHPSHWQQWHPIPFWRMTVEVFKHHWHTIPFTESQLWLITDTKQFLKNNLKTMYILYVLFYWLSHLGPLVVASFVLDLLWLHCLTI